MSTRLQPDAFDEFLDGQEYDELVSEEDLDDL